MSPELRKRMEEAAEHKHPAHEDGFKEGAQWMHDNEVVPRDELIELLIKALKKSNQDTRRLLDFYNNFEQMKGGE